MRLGSGDGDSVVLEVLGYEFPQAHGRMDRWDKNWLDIQGIVRVSGGRSWGFTHPCLTTFEAERLGSWLRDIRIGQATSMLFFTEPLLDFQAEPTRDGSVKISIGLGHEASPPSELIQPGDARDFLVVVTLSLQDLDQAITDWDRACTKFSER